MQEIELLAPAGNVSIGRSAIMSGADAIYIGAPKFGARINAGNSMSEIASLVDYAHTYNAKIYLTMNTILYDEEVEEAANIAKEAERIGVDALIVQDMAYLKMGLKRIAFHASTQTCNFDIERIKLIEESGFDRIVLERSLSLDEISEIRKNTNLEIESFVHGAMCVGFSGNCYLSHYLCGRSGNRGECAQVCRSHYNLYQENGKLIKRSCQLLSVGDIDFSDRLKELIDAGVTSFKIEGRLKDESYVINNVAFYNRLLNSLNVKRSSNGSVETKFEPDTRKSFFRGTSRHMFIDDKRAIVGAPSKNLGESAGMVVGIKDNGVALKTTLDLHNGDGLSWVSCDFVQHGAYINNVQQSGDEKILKMTSYEGLSVSLNIYRNQDKNFNPDFKDVKRVIRIKIFLSVNSEELIFRIGNFKYIYPYNYVESNKDPKETILSCLSKSGDSPFVVDSIEIESKLGRKLPFFKISELNQIRRNLLEEYGKYVLDNYSPMKHKAKISNELKFPKELSYKWNVSNRLAKKFYLEHGAESIEPPLEKQEDVLGKRLMVSRHCIRRQIGLCPKDNNNIRVAQPLFLENNGKFVKVIFDCTKCLMYLEATSSFRL